MKTSEARAMLSDIIEQVDYDIWKDGYNLESAEDPDQVDLNYDKLIDIIELHYLKLEN